MPKMTRNRIYNLNFSKLFHYEFIWKIANSNNIQYYNSVTHNLLTVTSSHMTMARDLLGDKVLL